MSPAGLLRLHKSDRYEPKPELPSAATGKGQVPGTGPPACFAATAYPESGNSMTNSFYKQIAAVIISVMLNACGGGGGGDGDGDDAGSWQRLA
jgi:hypothetical protein